MRILALIAVLAALAWGGYWVVGARALDRGIAEALQRVPEFSAESHTVRGFPNRFDVTLDEPRFASGGLGWSAPFVQVFALTYKPHHLLTVFAHDQRLEFGGLEALLHSDDLRASLVMQPSLDLPLDRFTLVGEAVELQLDGTTHRAAGLRTASRRITPREHDLVVLAETVLPDAALMERLDPQGLWPRRFDVLRLDARAVLDRPLDRHVATGEQPRVTEFALTGAQVFYDETQITATGALIPGPDGLLSGEIALSVLGWRDLMRRARDAGLMPAEHDALVAMALQGLVSHDDPERIEAAFSVTDGMIRMGPITLGQLPPLF